MADILDLKVNIVAETSDGPVTATVMIDGKLLELDHLGAADVVIREARPFIQQVLDAAEQGKS